MTEQDIFREGDRISFSYNKRRVKYGNVIRAIGSTVTVKLDANETQTRVKADRLKKVAL